MRSWGRTGRASRRWPMCSRGGRGMKVRSGGVDRSRSSDSCSRWSRTSAPRRGCSSASNIRSKFPACLCFSSCARASIRSGVRAARRSFRAPSSSGWREAQATALGMDAEMLKRPVNVGFSGGEKKRAEMVQMGIMNPKLAILDETDSGLDIDALKSVGAGINRIMRAPDKGGAADHPLPAPARLREARPRARAVARQDRAQRRRRTGARARARRLCGGGA